MEDLTSKRLGAYQVVAPLGHGGMAAVYKAYQPAMDRYVALKILPRQLALDPEFVGRFEQEAKVIAKLQHPHILPVHDFGEADGYTYIVMPFVDSGTLADLMKRGPLPLDRIIGVMKQVGDALNYAHSRGIVHRDVKPSNVLVDASGNCLLTDFGISKIVESSARFTVTGSLVGTPAYMSPEQAKGMAVDQRSDLYALGVILYEMATGQVPYTAETPLAVVIKHINDPLPLPRTMQPNLPEAVERVILKSLAKDPAERYASAAEMVAALQTAPDLSVSRTPLSTAVEMAPALSPVSTPPASTTLAPPPPKTALRFSMRVLGLAGIAVLTLIGAGVLFGAVPLMLALVTTATPTITATLTSPPLTATSAPTPTFTHTPTPLPTATPIPTPDVALFVELGRWQAPGEVRSLAWSPDGTRLALGLNDSTVRIWDAATGSEQFKLDEDEFPVLRVAWSPNGRRLAFGGDDGVVRIWNAETEAVEFALTGHSDNMLNLAWSPDGMRLVSTGDDFIVRVWDAVNGQPLQVLTGHSGSVWGAAWAPDGSRFATSAFDGQIRIWDAATGKALHVLDGRQDWVMSLSWSADGTRLASAGTNGLVRIWDPDTGTEVGSVSSPEKGWLWSVAWSPSGGQVVTSGKDGIVRVWEVQTGAQLRQFEGHTKEVWGGAAWSPDGTRIASGALDGLVIVRGLPPK
jgi:serine/threonine protein kinase